MELLQVTLSIRDEKTLKHKICALIHTSNDLDTHELTIIKLNEQQEIRKIWQFCYL